MFFALKFSIVKFISVVAMDAVRLTVTAIASPLATSLSDLRNADKPWQAVAKEAQEYRDQSLSIAGADFTTLSNDLPLNVTKIPLQLLTTEEIEITEQTPEKLLGRLLSGNLSAIDATNAFLRRAALAQKLVRCSSPFAKGATDLDRQTASLNCFQFEHGLVQYTLITTWPSTVIQLVRSMVYQSRSKNTLESAALTSMQASYLVGVRMPIKRHTFCKFFTMRVLYFTLAPLSPKR